MSPAEQIFALQCAATFAADVNHRPQYLFGHGRYAELTAKRQHVRVWTNRLSVVVVICPTVTAGFTVW